MIPTYEDFREFVRQTAEEGPDWGIDHFCWSSCAVGAFLREHGMTDCLPSSLFESGGPVAKQLYSTLDEQGIYYDAEGHAHLLDTYGKLEAYIQELEGLYHEETQRDS